jgi:hypothetical protein
MGTAKPWPRVLLLSGVVVVVGLIGLGVAWALVHGQENAVIAVATVVYSVTACVLVLQWWEFRRLVDMSLRFNMMQGLREILRAEFEHPSVSRHLHPRWSDCPDDQVRADCLADMYSYELDTVLEFLEWLPADQRPMYEAYIRGLLRDTPAIHEWLKLTAGSWSPRLQAIAEEVARARADGSATTSQPAP